MSSGLLSWHLIADLSKVQDDEVGDGTTSVAVLAGELLREAEILISQKIHPMIIIDGFRKACDTAVATLQVLVSMRVSLVLAVGPVHFAAVMKTMHSSIRF